MTISLKEVIGKIEEICNVHFQISTFLYGQIGEVYKSNTIEHTAVILDVNSATVNPTDISVTMTVAIVDKVLKDAKNKIDVESETLLILRDIINIMQTDNTWRYCGVVTPPTAVRVVEKELDVVSGWVATIQLRLMKINGLTDIPADGLPVPPTTSCDPANYTITDGDGNVLYSGTVASGGNISQSINDSVATLKDTDGNILSTTNILAEGTADIVAPDSAITVNSNAFGDSLSGGSLDVPVEYVNGTPVGNIVSGVVEIPNPDYNTINIVEYIADDTYVKPSNLLYAKVICVGGGGGGGGGRGYNGQQLGGSGGGGGSLAYLTILNNDVPSSVAVTIGIGGSGGNGLVGSGSEDGLVGGTTSFDVLVTAVGGEGGFGGVINPLPLSVGGGKRVNNTPIYYPNSISGGTSGRGSNNGNAVVTTQLHTGGDTVAGVGGGGGGGHTTAFNNANGGRGGVVLNKIGTEFFSAGGTGTTGGNGVDGVDDISVFEAEDGQISNIGIGTSAGGGGNATDDINMSGTGGNGGRGSGGGAAGNYKSGVLPIEAIPGGNGGDGFCIIYEYLYKFGKSFIESNITTNHPYNFDLCKFISRLVQYLQEKNI